MLMASLFIENERDRMNEYWNNIVSAVKLEVSKNKDS